MFQNYQIPLDHSRVSLYPPFPHASILWLTVQLPKSLGTFRTSDLPGCWRVTPTSQMYQPEERALSEMCQVPTDQEENFKSSPALLQCILWSDIDLPQNERK